MNKLPIVLAAILAASTTGAAEPELKGSPGELTTYLAGLPKMVSVIGESELKVPADRAIVTLKIVTEQKLLQETLRLNQETRARVISLLKARAIPPERVQSSKFSSTIKTGVFSDRAKSYRVENLLKVKVQDEKEFQAVAQVVDTVAEVQLQGIDFEQSDKEVFKTKALDAALDNAAARKRIFEEKLGVKLTPKTFTLLPQVQPARPYLTGSYPSETPASSGIGYSKRVPADAAEEIGSPFGESTFSVRVSVEYLVESK